MMEPLLQADLREEMVKVERSSKVESLLERLEEEDKFFIVNVPEEIRKTYSDVSLLEHLKQTYKQPFFYIEDPKLIEAHINVGSRVVKKGDFSKLTYELKRGSEGEVLIPYVHSAYVIFYDNGRREIEHEDLVVCGRKAGFLRPAKEYPDTSAEDFNLKPGDIVKYAGEDIREYESDKIPDGTYGLLVAKTNKGYFIVWAEGEGVDQEILKRYSGILPRNYFSCNELTLVRPNEIKYDDLYQKVMRGKNSKEETIGEGDEQK